MISITGDIINRKSFHSAGHKEGLVPGQMVSFCGSSRPLLKYLEIFSFYVTSMACIRMLQRFIDCMPALSDKSGTLMLWEEIKSDDL